MEEQEETEAKLNQVIIFVLRQRTDWKMVIGDQRIGAYATAEAACWAAMSMAVHLREEGAAVELRLHDDKGIQRIWPPEQIGEVRIQRGLGRKRPLAVA